MVEKDKYPELANFIENYFGEDFDLWGNTIPEIVDFYKRESEPSQHNLLINEINNFTNNNIDDLDRCFKEVYGLYFDPEPWGHTTSSFLNELKRLLQE